MSSQNRLSKSELLDISKIAEDTARDIAIRNRKYSFVEKVTSNAIWVIPAVIGLLVFSPVGDWFGLRGKWWHTVSLEDLQGYKIIGDPSAVSGAVTTVITVLGPIIIGIIIWLITTVGVGRLKRFDEIIDNIRIALRESEKQVFDRLTDFKDDLGKQPETIAKTVEDRVFASLANTLERETDEQRRQIKDFFADATEEVREISKGIENRFGQIAETAGYAKANSKFGPLTSVGAVHHKVTDLYRQQEREQAVLLVQELLDQFGKKEGIARPAGSLNGDWFNLSAQLGRNKEERLALSICLAGLSQQNGASVFDDNGKANWKDKSILPDDDLLAHAIQYAQTVNDARLSELIRLNGFDNQAKLDGWGWRQFSFTMNALSSLGRYQEAIKLGNRFKDDPNRPVDSDTGKVIETLGSIMRARGDRKRAEEILQSWLDKNPDAAAAQICSTLLDWLDGSSETERVIELANRGIRDLAEEQASTKLGNLFYRRALVRDRRAVDIFNGKQHTGIEICAEIENALADYKVALETDLIRSLHPQVERRMLVLRRIGEDQGCDIAEPATVSTAEGDDTESHVKSVLSNVLPILMDDKPGSSKAAMLREILSEKTPVVRALVLQFLDQMSEDEDTPTEMRRAVSQVLPLLQS